MLEPATHTVHDEVGELLGKIRDAAPSPARPICTAEARHFAMRLEAAAEENGFTVTITVTTAAGHPARIEDPATLALEVDGRYFIGMLTRAGFALFRSVPAAEWNPWWVRGRDTRAGEDPGFALPLPRRQAELAAAGRRSGTAVTKVVLPAAQGTLTLHYERDRGYLVEIDRADRADQLVVITVRFGREDGSEGLVVIPVWRSGLARLDGFSPVAPWQASLATGARLPALTAVSVASSIRACDLPESSSITAVAFSPDAKTLATVSAGVQLWNAVSHQPEGLPLGSPDTPSSLAFSANGKTLVAGYEDGVVRFWNVITHQQIGAAVTVASNSDQIDVMTFSPDGQTLAIGSDDGVVRLVDVSTGQPIGEQLMDPGFTGGVQVLSFTPDGRTLVVGTVSGTLLLHVDYLEDPVAYLCGMAGRSFTPAEWAQNVPGVGYQDVCG